MKSLRSRILVAVFFGLISLGQAYPLSYIWAHLEAVSCGCNQSGRKCIHGCQVKKRPAKVHACHSEKTWSWVNPGCSKQKEAPSLQFQQEPFLPQRTVFLLGRVTWAHEIRQGFYASHWTQAPDPPPPRSA